MAYIRKATLHGTGHNLNKVRICFLRDLSEISRGGGGRGVGILNLGLEIR